MIAVVRVTMIVFAYLLLPFYGLWLLTGVWADRQDRRRFAERKLP